MIHTPVSNSKSNPIMNAITLLTRSGSADLTPEEDAQLTRELAAAYHMDEAAASSRDVQRIAEKVRARLASPPADPSPSREG
jgi:hypothetical protein